MRVRHVILDWSGTMVDDLRPVWQTTNRVFQHFGRAPLTVEGFRRDFCLPIRRFYAAQLPAVPLAEVERVFLAEYPAHRDQIVPLPHTEEFLRFCAAAGLSVFVASSADAGTYDRQMRRLGWTKYLTKSYIGLEDKTQTIHHILQTNQLAPAVTLFAGDMEHDIAAGRAGGVRTCAVLSGYNHEATLRALHPDLVCEHLGALQAVLEPLEISRG